MTWHWLKELFNRSEKEKDIKLYCQNRFCRHPLIHKGENIAYIDEKLIHSDRNCVEMYFCNKTFQAENIFTGTVDYIPYNEAEKLAKDKKVKFSKLEWGVEE